MEIKLRENYKKTTLPQIKESLGLSNAMAVPKLEKIILSTCLSEAIKNPKVLDVAVNELSLVAGQKAVVTRGKKSVSNFKLREGQPVGVKVTLRRDAMWSFLERLIHLALPRSKDFRGLSRKSFDGRANYNMGLKEQGCFPELDYDKIDKTYGLNITICTTGKTDDEGLALLQGLGFPFKKN